MKAMVKLLQLTLKQYAKHSAIKPGMMTVVT